MGSYIRAAAVRPPPHPHPSRVEAKPGLRPTFPKMEWVKSIDNAVEKIKKDGRDPDASEILNLKTFVNSSGEHWKALMHCICNEFVLDDDMEVSFQWPDCPDDWGRCTNLDGFWLLTLVEADRERVCADIESAFLSARAGSELIGKFASHANRQQPRISMIRFDEVECSTAEDVLLLAQLLKKCGKFKVIQLHLTLEDEMTEGWRALADQLTRFPTKEIHASRKALQGCTERDCLRLVWETGTSSMWKVDGVDVAVQDKDEGWAKIEQIIDGE